MPRPYRPNPLPRECPKDWTPPADLAGLDRAQAWRRFRARQHVRQETAAEGRERRRREAEARGRT